jgi:acetyl-CoA C-acetyltransferase
MAEPGDEDRIPVIVGTGEIADKTPDLASALEPAALMAEALARAECDAGVKLLARVDSLDVINEASWPYRDPCREVSARAGLSPRRAAYGMVGGETPVQATHEAALRIARGESAVAAICGAEAEHIVRKAAKLGVELPWGGRDLGHVPIRASAFQQPIARALDAATPAHVYPFYENAFQKSQGQSPDEGRGECAELWAGFSRTAAGRSNAWLGRPFEASEIAAISASNRMIAWPYPKFMTANPVVNQGAAILITSAGYAKRAGILSSRWVYILGGASAREPDDYLARDGYAAVPAMRAVLSAIRRCLPRGHNRFDCHELYSCFPCVPKMARLCLGLDRNEMVTVTGGLTFFGAPLNNYMTHAAAAMVEHLRAHPGQAGLLYGQGGYATKHHALALISGEQAWSAPAPRYSVQQEAEAMRGTVPRFLPDFEGMCAIESFTVLYDRDGEVRHGVIIARVGQEVRAMARVPPEETAALTDGGRNPIGLTGLIKFSAHGLPEWRFT